MNKMNVCKGIMVVMFNFVWFGRMAPSLLNIESTLVAVGTWTASIILIVLSYGYVSTIFDINAGLYDNDDVD